MLASFGAIVGLTYRAVLDDVGRFHDASAVTAFLGLVADTSLLELRVAGEFDAVVISRGRPSMYVSDNGAELTSMRSCNGRRRRVSTGTASRLASPLRMLLWSVSTTA